MKFCCAEKKLFFIGWLCMNGKSRLFRKTKTVPCAENLSKCIRKPLISARQTPSFFHKSFFSVLERHPILQTKNFPFEQAFPCYSQKPAFFAPKAFLLYKPSLIVTQSTPFPPSALHSHPAITYCPPKNTAILFISALTPYAVTPEHRTDSNPHRRYPESLRLSPRPVT